VNQDEKMKLNLHSTPKKIPDPAKGNAVAASLVMLSGKKPVGRKMVRVGLNPQVIYVNASAQALQRAVRISEEYSASCGKDGDPRFEEA